MLLTAPWHPVLLPVATDSASERPLEFSSLAEHILKAHDPGCHNDWFGAATWWPRSALRRTPRAGAAPTSGSVAARDDSVDRVG